MNINDKSFRPIKPSEEKGAALLTVMVILLLSLLLVAASTRKSLFNEAFTGNDSDYGRALEAAQILMADAEADINGELPNGSACANNCRPTTGVFFPPTAQEFDSFRRNLQAQSTVPCSNGICLSLCPSTIANICNADGPAFWQNADALATMSTRAASYGQFTGANPGTTGNKILMSGRAWYWVEVMLYGQIMPNNIGAPNDLDKPYIYRITVVAQGNKPGTQAVLQTFVSKRNNLK